MVMCMTTILLLCISPSVVVKLLVLNAIQFQRIAVQIDLQ